MKSLFKFLSLVVLMCLIILLSGCWPGAFTKKVKNFPTKLQRIHDNIDKQKASFDNLKNEADYNKIAKYAEKEDWESNFQKANVEFNHAEKIYTNEIASLLKKKKRESIPIAEKHFERISTSLKIALDFSKKPMQRAEQLLNAIKKMPEITQQSEKEFKESKVISSRFFEFAKKAQIDYPKKKSDISKKISAVNKILDDIKKANTTIKSESKSKEPDYANLIDNSTLLTQKLSEIDNKSYKLKTKIEELYKCYTKTLTDMKFEQKPWMNLVQYSWSNYSDWDNTRKTKDENVDITMTEFREIEEKFKKYPNGYVVKCGSDYEIWVENYDLEENYYHRYAITEDGDRSLTGWREVKEDYYEKYEDDLGMDIVAKPYGYYEEEVIEQSTPEGMALVGNKDCGRWRNDHRGNRYWEWYGRYHFYSRIFGGHRYYYNDWNRWNTSYRGVKPYYGKSGDQYGTTGQFVQSNSRYQNTDIGRKSNFRSQSSSVRGAGTASRGRGPGGGGK
ncbi:MAG: hypothetical protein K8S23_00105 [Candidatus Cloacimonetes bacterium]|nr:hypothetical protein [Candidatus Cloacimonadota bacterium]